MSKKLIDPFGLFTHQKSIFRAFNRLYTKSTCIIFLKFDNSFPLSLCDISFAELYNLNCNVFFDNIMLPYILVGF